MEEAIRRSSRQNKGTHSGRDEHDLYYLPSEESAAKRAKIEPSGHLKQFDIPANDDDEGKVRCDGCGTTEENYDEDTDSGGMMIECEQCKTWQHARCMGYRLEKQIPKIYLCNRCTKIAESKEKGDGEWQESAGSMENRGTTRDHWDVKAIVKSAPLPRASTPGLSAPVNSILSGTNKHTITNTKSAQESKTRASVSKALVNVILRADSTVGDAAQWGEKLEAAIYAWAGATDKKYIEKSRSVMALVKKPAVFARLVARELTPADFTNLPVEEIDPALRDYAEKVRQELIRRSVLTVSDDQSQRIRRTHKGEEIVETKADEHADDLGVGMIARNVDHRKFSDENVVIPTVKNVIPSLYQLGDDDDDYTHNNAEAEQADSDGGSDDELDFILKAKDSGKSKDANEKAPQKTSERKIRMPALPPTIPTEFWAGEIAFPDVATFGVLAEFVACTNYERPRDNITVSFHNRAMRVCKELMERKSYLVEGRLDRAKADPYLLQIVKSRDLYLVKLKKEDPSYSKVYEYLLNRSKVGVLSGRAPMVKDAYLFAFNHDAPSYMNFTAVGEGLYVLFSVKKDYVPVGKSILKKASPPMQASSAAVANLDSILLKLEGSVSGNMAVLQLPQRTTHMHHAAQPQPSLQVGPEQLSQDQMSYLSSIVKQNPHVQSDPQALLNLLQLMQT